MQDFIQLCDSIENGTVYYMISGDSYDVSEVPNAEDSFWRQIGDRQYVSGLVSVFYIFQFDMFF